jgi:hypothetical protein
MKEILISLLSTSKERISNPIVGNFLISWIAFNWKPIIYILKTNESIENQITYIDTNFYSFNNLLLYPLIFVLIYNLALPYLNLLFECLLEFPRIKINIISITKEKQIIENKKELAIEEIKLEEAQIEFKERKHQNKLIEELEKSNQAKDEQISIERDRFNELNKRIQEESAYLNKRFNEDKIEFELKIKSLLKENESLRKNIREVENDFNGKLKLSNNENSILSSNRFKFSDSHQDKKQL